MRILTRALAILLVVGTSLGFAAPSWAQAPVKFRIEWGQKLTLRDGVQVQATVYIPTKPEGTANGKLPAVLNITVYGADGRSDICSYFAANNFVCVAVDSRGRGNSGGSFVPWATDSQDGYDIVEAVAKLPSVDGRVVMWGGSYSGFNQWAAARLRPPSLKAIAPVAAVFPSYDYPYGANVPFYYDMTWLSYTSGRTDNARLFGHTDYWASVQHRHHTDMAAFRELDKYAGNMSTVFQQWVANPMSGPYWDAFTPTAAEYAAIDLPVLHITGTYDGDQGGSMNYYRQFNANASPATLAKQNMIIGPWDHAGTRIPRAEFGGIKVGPNSVMDLRALHVEWYNWVLRGGNKPAFLDAPVKWYEFGTDTWHKADTIDQVSASTRPFYLTSGANGSGSVFQSGALTDTRPVGANTDSYVNDPKDMKYAPLVLTPSDAGLTDQRDQGMIKGDGLVYHSAPFTEDVTFAGWPKFEADIAMTTRDADVLVRLYEVLPDGSVLALSSDILRARYRNSFRSERLMTPGRAERFTFSRFTWFSRKISKGSRLRLIINSPNGNGYQKNFQGGGVVANETGADAKVSTISIKTDSAKLSLPVAKL
jgi:uncharacterized protein